MTSEMNAATTAQKGEKPKKVIHLKPYAPFEIAEIYEVDKRTLNKWLKPFKEDIGPRQGRFYTIAQVKKIFEKLCVPGIVIIE